MSMKILSIVLCFLVIIHLCSGSCYQFGHACFGAHGKRSNAAEALASKLEPENPSNTIAFSNYVRNWIERLRERRRQLQNAALENEMQEFYPQEVLEPIL